MRQAVIIATVLAGILASTCCVCLLSDAVDQEPLRCNDRVLIVDSFYAGMEGTVVNEYVVPLKETTYGVRLDEMVESQNGGKLDNFRKFTRDQLVRLTDTENSAESPQNDVNSELTNTPVTTEETSEELAENP